MDVLEDKIKENLKYDQIEENIKYQTIVYLPFLTKSSWTQTEYKEEKLKERAISAVKSALQKKYNAIKIRDYNNKERFEKFRDFVGKNLKEEDLKIEYSNGLHHSAMEKKIGEKTVSEIWDELEKVKKITTINDIPENCTIELSENKFNELLLSSNCSYCGISIEMIYKLAEKKQLFTKRARGYSLEVDQIDPFGNYKDGNCAASCYWCNNTKTDEFTVSEFKEIARGINQVWNQRLKKVDINETICFPENSKIWGESSGVQVVNCPENK